MLIKRLLKISITLVALVTLTLFAYHSFIDPEMSIELRASAYPKIETIQASANKPEESKLRLPSQAIQSKPKTKFSNESPPKPLLQNPYAIPPRENFVEFQIQDGMAIAFGDVILGVPQGNVPGNRGIAEVPKYNLWDKAEIPFAISPELPNPERVESAIQYFHEHTSMKWIPFQGQEDAVVFEPGKKDCYSYVGRVGGVQSIKLSIGCQGPEILHEMMHALGFVHEHSRLDRDQYINVVWSNIDDEHKPQFAIVPEMYFEPFRGTPFDYHSVMLYKANSFAKQKHLTSIQSKTNEAISPVSQGLSELDLYRLNRLYGY